MFKSCTRGFTTWRTRALRDYFFPRGPEEGHAIESSREGRKRRTPVFFGVSSFVRFVLFFFGGGAVLVFLLLLLIIIIIVIIIIVYLYLFGGAGVPKKGHTASLHICSRILLSRKPLETQDTRLIDRNDG